MAEGHGCIHEDQSGGAQRVEDRRAEAKAVSATQPLVYPNYYASVFLASPNYSSRSAYSPGGPPRVLVIHDMEGTYAASVSWLRNPQAQASAHYAVGANGENCQMVSEQYAAWHVAYCNGFTIGIEHEGYASTGRYYTQKMYETSAKLAAGICHRWNIPVVRSTSRGICAHADLGASGGGHHDPGPYWDWDRYLALVRQYMRKTPKPTPHTRLYRVQVGAFSDEQNAEGMVARLKKAGFDGFISHDGSLYRVQAGAFSEKKNAEELVARLKKAGFDAIVTGG